MSNVSKLWRCSTLVKTEHCSIVPGKSILCTSPHFYILYSSRFSIYLYALYRWPVYWIIEFSCNKKASLDKYVQAEIDSSCETTKKVPWSLVLQSSHLGDAFGCREATSSIVFPTIDMDRWFQDSTRSREES